MNWKSSDRRRPKLSLPLAPSMIPGSHTVQRLDGEKPRQKPILKMYVIWYDHPYSYPHFPSVLAGSQAFVDGFELTIEFHDLSLDLQPHGSMLLLLKPMFWERTIGLSLVWHGCNLQLKQCHFLAMWYAFRSWLGFFSFHSLLLFGGNILKFLFLKKIERFLKQ